MLCDLEYDASYLLYDIVCEIPFAFYVTFAGTTNLADVEKWAGRKGLVVLEEFRKTFKNKFYPRSFCDAKRNEFMSLVQGDMIVAEYEKRFIELDATMRVKRCMVDDKKYKIFKKGPYGQSFNSLRADERRHETRPGVKRQTSRNEETLNLVLIIPHVLGLVMEEDFRGKIEVDLILFELDELDEIFGMDFLTKYHAILDCSNKKARKLMNKRHTAYLTHMVDTQTSKDDSSKEPIVRKYLDDSSKDYSVVVSFSKSRIEMGTHNCRLLVWVVLDTQWL
ncbi:Pyridoxal-phosphate-dependent serine hydroxymethyltransferase [Cucumis melo var. makuwa]|uniref:Pyridoxal-phosphate-dependent serine hydroxymethyltransferase n=1 Tax=Cucumis melo var. makuwa TaxID=1194695 RepID=A0A5A7U1R2_CUCMM|nr:Pyridoxal-phosphate-dependent serine hydroxymethyltransferase [Cucumis melo var. makuwa]TYK14969.1 Pyridoxal-phosphate-dependent serine hydroxymethyltransferase [Cucumis melo var. makuwa]